MRISVIYCLLISICISSCKKDIPSVEQKKPKTLSEAGITNEIDIYKPGTYWIYSWSQFSSYGGARIDNGIDTLKVVSAIQCDSCRQLMGTVFGQTYSETYLITQSEISYRTATGQLFYLQSPAIIPFDSSDTRIDYPVNSADRAVGGCTNSISFLYSRNIPVSTLAGNFVSILATQRLNGGGNYSACPSAFEKINYVRGIGEVYRITSYEAQDYNAPIRFTRELISYNISH